MEAPPPAPTPSASSSASTSAQPPQPQATPASSKDLAAKECVAKPSVTSRCIYIHTRTHTTIDPLSPPHSALIHSLQSQLQTTRTELSDLYKSHTHLTTRLLTLSDQSASHSSLTTQLSLLTRREQDLRDSSSEKDKVIELLQDELRTLSLELGQVEEREERLKRDNAGLVKRWLERAREEVERVNVANEWVEEVQERKRREGQDAGNKEAGMGRETEGGGDKAKGE